MYIKQPLKTQKKLKKIWKLYIKTQSLSIFLDVTKFADFWLKKD